MPPDARSKLPPTPPALPTSSLGKVPLQEGSRSPSSPSKVPAGAVVPGSLLSAGDLDRSRLRGNSLEMLLLQDSPGSASNPRSSVEAPKLPWTPIFARKTPPAPTAGAVALPASASTVAQLSPTSPAEPSATSPARRSATSPRHGSGSVPLGACPSIDLMAVVEGSAGASPITSTNAAPAPPLFNTSAAASTSAPERWSYSSTPSGTTSIHPSSVASAATVPSLSPSPSPSPSLAAKEDTAAVKQLWPLKPPEPPVPPGGQQQQTGRREAQRKEPSPPATPPCCSLGQYLERCASGLRQCLGLGAPPVAAPQSVWVAAGQHVSISAARHLTEQARSAASAAAGPAARQPGLQTKPRPSPPPAAAPAPPPRPGAAASPRPSSTADNAYLTQQRARAEKRAVAPAHPGTALTRPLVPRPAPAPEAAASPRAAGTADNADQQTREEKRAVAPARPAAAITRPLLPRPSPALAASIKQRSGSAVRSPVNEDRFAKFMAQCDERGPQGGVMKARDLSRSQLQRKTSEPASDAEESPQLQGTRSASAAPAAAESPFESSEADAEVMIGAHCRI